MLLPLSVPKGQAAPLPPELAIKLWLIVAVLLLLKIEAEVDPVLLPALLFHMITFCKVDRLALLLIIPPPLDKAELALMVTFRKVGLLI